MLWLIAIILVVLWLAGSLGHVGGSMIHLLLLVAVVVVVFSLVSRRGNPL